MKCMLTFWYYIPFVLTRNSEVLKEDNRFLLSTIDESSKRFAVDLYNSGQISQLLLTERRLETTW